MTTLPERLEDSFPHKIGDFRGQQVNLPDGGFLK